MPYYEHACQRCGGGTDMIIGHSMADGICPGCAEVERLRAALAGMLAKSDQATNAYAVARRALAAKSSSTRSASGSAAGVSVRANRCAVTTAQSTVTPSRRRRITR